MARIEGNKPFEKMIPSEPQSLQGHHHHKKKYVHPQKPSRDEISSLIEQLKKETQPGQENLTPQQIQNLKKKLQEWEKKFPMGSKEKDILQQQLKILNSEKNINLRSVEKTLEQLILFK